MNDRGRGKPKTRLCDYKDICGLTMVETAGIAQERYRWEGWRRGPRLLEIEPFVHDDENERKNINY